MTYNVFGGTLNLSFNFCSVSASVNSQHASSCHFNCDLSSLNCSQFLPVSTLEFHHHSLTVQVLLAERSVSTDCVIQSHCQVFSQLVPCAEPVNFFSSENSVVNFYSSEVAWLILHGWLTLNYYRLVVQIIHLKRFQFHNGRWVKSHKIVKFPFRDFDPTNYLVPDSSLGNRHHDNHNNNTETDNNYHDDDDNMVSTTTTAGVRHSANGHLSPGECQQI